MIQAPTSCTHRFVADFDKHYSLKDRKCGMRNISLRLRRIYLHREDKKPGACKAHVWPWTELYQTSSTLWNFCSAARRKQPLGVERRKTGHCLHPPQIWQHLVGLCFLRATSFFVNLSCCEVKVLVTTMGGPLVLQMYVVLTLQTFLTGVEVANAKVIRGNIRRDGKILTFISDDACSLSCFFL